MAGPAICFVVANPPESGSVETDSEWLRARRMGYGAGLRACVNSLRRRHRTLPPLILLKAGPAVTLADVDQVISIDTGAYKDIPVANEYYGSEIFYKLEVFNVRGYDRIVYLDCDTLVLDDISLLWNMERYSTKALYAMKETADMGVHPVVAGKFNTGVMVVNQPLLAGTAYRRLIEIARDGKSYDGGDQGIINQYLDEQTIALAGDLDPEYNVMVLIKKRGQWNKFKDRIRILHFTNQIKPWAPDHHHDGLFDVEFKQLWDEAFRFGPAAFRD